MWMRTCTNIPCALLACVEMMELVYPETLIKIVFFQVSLFCQSLGDERSLSLSSVNSIEYW